MSFAIQRVSMFFLNIFQKPVSRIAPKTREKVMTVCFFLLSAALISYFCAPFYIQLRWKMLIGCVLMAVILLMSLDRKVAPVKWTLLLTVPYFLVCLFLMQSGVTQSFEYLPNALVCLVAFPAFWLVWTGRGDFQVLYRCFARGFTFAYWIFLALSVLFAPLAANYYSGLAINPNGMGMILSVALVSSIYLFEISVGKLRWVYLATAGNVIAMSFLSQSRSALLSHVAVLIVWFIYIAVKEHRRWRVMLRRWLFPVLAILLSLVIMYTLLTTVNQLFSFDIDDVYYDIAVYVSEHSKSGETEILFRADAFSDKLEFGDLMTLRLLQGISNNSDISTGRFNIWSAFLGERTLLGHPSEYKFIVPATGSVAGTAHNTPIQIGYDSGFPNTFFWFALNAASGLYAIFYAVRRRREGINAFFPLLCIVAYGITSMVESSYNPLTGTLPLAYFIAMTPLFKRGSCARIEKQ